MGDKDFDPTEWYDDKDRPYVRALYEDPPNFDAFLEAIDDIQDPMTFLGVAGYLSPKYITEKAYSRVNGAEPGLRREALAAEILARASDDEIKEHGRKPPHTDLDILKWIEHIKEQMGIARSGAETLEFEAQYRDLTTALDLYDQEISKPIHKVDRARLRGFGLCISELFQENKHNKENAMPDELWAAVASFVQLHAVLVGSIVE